MKKILLVSMIVIKALAAYSQDKKLDGFHASIDITNNGISMIPSFSLGAPAGSLMLSMRKGDFSFEPIMRFSLKGKPWSFVFWLRHQLIHTEKFNLRLGAHPSLLFNDISVSYKGINRDVLETKRYLACEVAPTYKLTERLSAAVYYLYGRGIDQGWKNTFLTACSLGYNFPLGKQSDYFANIIFQPYYLKIDNAGGTFLAGYLTLGKKGFPISLQSILNKKMNSDIPTKDFNWNLSVFYSF